MIMRLLHSTTLKLHEFSYGRSQRPPPYAILSHTWIEGEEVSLQDIQASPAGLKAGYAKIKNCCRIAAADGFEYVWIDTCCIEKTSSSELSEAINSMYRWYEEAEVCYAYLSDVSSLIESDRQGSFSKSRWFTRGWTLQELIAPSTLIFFGCDWQELGTKSSLHESISRITSIHVGAVLGRDLKRFSIAQRMSWASNRMTTRLEDMAYSLMGIFGVNMPMLYGEGERAFIRLQEEIMRISDDQSIFAWAADIFSISHQGLLAPSPAVFRYSGSIVPREKGANTENDQLHSVSSITNRGVNLEIPVLADEQLPEKYQIGILNCKYVDNPEKLLGLFLNKERDGETNFARCLNYQLVKMNQRVIKPSDMRSIYVRQGNLERLNQPSLYNQYLLDVDRFKNVGFMLEGTFPNDLMQPDGTIRIGIDRINGHVGMFAGLKFCDKSGYQFILLINTKNDHCVNVVTDFGEETLEQVVSSFWGTSQEGERRHWTDESDCISRKRPFKKPLYITKKKKIISGKKTLVLDISFSLES